MKALAAAAHALLGLELDGAQLAALEQFAIELTSWNQQRNLTSIIDPTGIRIKHFLDSLSCVLALRATGAVLPNLKVVDVGSGAGFPGLPLKIVYPALRMTLIEATRKKCEFLEHVVQLLKLKGVTVLHARAEEIGRAAAHREHYDWAIARAVAPLPALLEYLLPLVRIGGFCLAQKGSTAAAEAQQAAAALAVLGGCLTQLLPVELPGLAEPRFLVLVAKQAAAPAKYPRRAGLPAKRPL
jgi:16S rRNA (guanine527-N7)-methyltransferase